MDIRTQLLRAVASSSLSERRISVNATGSPDTLRAIRNGATPRVDTLERLCEALGLRLQLSPGLSDPEDADGDATFRRQPPTRFTKKRQLPVYRHKDPSEKDPRPKKPDLAPAPDDLDDKQAFYFQMPDNSMLNAHIVKDDLCLISPCAPLRVDQRAWLRDSTGRETIRWVMRLSADGYDLGAWTYGPMGEPEHVHEHHTREAVVDRGVVVGVFRTKPSVTTPPVQIPDWRPDAVSELWRAGLFRDAPRKAAVALQELLTRIGDMQMLIKQMLGTGELSNAEGKQLVRVLEFRVHDAIRNIRFLLTGASSG